jgi:hypothetical protein
MSKKKIFLFSFFSLNLLCHEKRSVSNRNLKWIYNTVSHWNTTRTKNFYNVHRLDQIDKFYI